MSKKSFKRNLIETRGYYHSKNKKVVYPHERKLVSRIDYTYPEDEKEFWVYMEDLQQKMVGKVPKDVEKIDIVGVIPDGSVVQGEVQSIENGQVVINLGKYDAYINETEFSIVELGQTVPIHFDGKTHSHSKAKRELTRQDLLAAIETKDPIFFEAKVLESIYGGYWMDCQGVRCFMPGSLANIVRLTDYNSIVGDKLQVCAVGFDSKNNNIILSHRDYLKRYSVLRASTYERGELLELTVSGSNSSGYFLEVEEGVFGMISKSNLEENKEYKKGDKIKAFVLNHDKQGRLIFTQDAKSFLEIGTMIGDTEIVKIKEHYALVKVLENGVGKDVYGTILNRFIEDKDVGDKINVVITDIFKHKIHLKLVEDLM